MGTLTQTDIESISTKIKAIRAYLNTKTINSELEASIAIEQSLTLDELDTCLATHGVEAQDGDLATALKALLAQRWERIRHSPLNYTQRPSDPINLLCLHIANQIEPIPNNKNDIDQLAPGIGPYFLLMPSLTAWKDSYGANIHNFALYQFALSDNQTVFIPIEPCLVDAMESDTGQLKHMVCDPEGRYSLKLIHLNDGEELDNDDIPEHQLCLYLRDDVIHGRAKNREPFTLSEEQLVEQFKAQLTDEEKLQLSEDEQDIKGKKQYDAIKRALTPLIKKTLKLFKHPNGDIFCRYQKPGVVIPVRVVLDQQRLGKHAQPIIDMLANPAGQQPILSMHDDDIVYTATGKHHDVKLRDKYLGDQASLLHEALKQPVAKKGLTIGEEGAIFSAIEKQGYRRENQAFPDLSKSETFRVSNHSTITQAYCLYSERIHKSGATSFGERLWNLYIALGSGAHRAGNADERANEGIAAFSEYWNTYSEFEKKMLYATYPGLQQIIIALRPEMANGENCIGFTGSDIHAFLKRYPSLYQDNAVLKKHHLQQLETEIAKKSHAILDNSLDQPIDLPRFSTLSTTLFNDPYARRALRYALEHQQALPNDFLGILPLFSAPEKQTLLHLTNEQGDTALIQATTDQTVPIVHDLIKETPPNRIDARNKRGETALMRTVMNKQTGAAIANLLINAGADIHTMNRYGHTAVTLAVRHNNLDVLNVLIKQSVDPLLTKQEALHFAITNNSPLLETLLLEAATLSLADQNRLFENLLPDNRPGSQANTVLMYAATAQHPIIDELLLPLSRAKKSLSSVFSTSILDAKNSDGNTALILAAQNNLTEVVLKLINAGANIHAANNLGETALIQALQNGHTDVIDVLMHNGAKLPRNPITTSASSSRQQSTRKLPSFIVNERDPTSDLDTALIKAAKAGTIDEIKALAEAGADINAINRGGQTALTIATQNQSTDIITYLLAADADIRPVKATDVNAFTIARSQIPCPDQVIEALLLKAVKLNINDQEQLLAGSMHLHVLDYVFNRKAPFLSRLLEEIGTIDDEDAQYALLNARGLHGNTTLHMAVKDALQTGNTSKITQLIEAGAHVDITNADGDSPLSYAIQYQLNDVLAIVAVLLDAGATINQRDSLGKNALDYALAINDDSQITSALLLNAIHLPADDQADLLQDTVHYTCVLVYALDKHPHDYQVLLDEASITQKTRVTEGLDALDSIEFDHYLMLIKDKADQLRRRWFRPSEKNQTVMNTATELYERLRLARLTFLQSEEPLAQKKLTFKASCLDALKQAEPVLKPQRGFKVILDALPNLINLRLIVMARIKTGKWSFFQTETASTSIVRGLKENLSEDDDQMGPPLPEQ